MRWFVLSALACASCAEPPVAELSPVDLTFSLLSYNTQTRPYLDDPAFKLPRIAPLLADYDVVGLQELFTEPQLLTDVTSFSSEVLFEERATLDAIVGSGLATLTSFPVTAVEKEHFRKPGELQNLIASKGVLLTRLDVEGVVVDVYETHMAAGAEPETVDARMDQAAQVAEIVARYSTPDHVVIVHGDFNMSPSRNKPFDAYEPAHYADAADMEHRTAAYDLMAHGLGTRDVIDELGPQNDDIHRVLWRDATNARLEPLSLKRERERFRDETGAPLSDSPPVVTRFRLTR
jgi:endonuclease/exonuclease/phosphatase family metal-dependent hydrolase